MPIAIHSLPRPSPAIWVGAIVFSAIAHVTLVTGIDHKKPTAPVDYAKVKVAEVIPPKEAAPEDKPKPKPKKTDPPKPPPNQKVDPSKPEAPPIQGLTKESTSATGTMAAPVGNTMMIEDTGKRLNPDLVQPLSGDLSAPATLVRDSIKSPPYTEQALDASLEGTWVVDVFVTVDGHVKDAELRKKIGYGMDERVLSAAKEARFIPRKNKLGATEEGWAEIKFTLVIP